jgi:hypothetical protein
LREIELLHEPYRLRELDGLKDVQMKWLEEVLREGDEPDGL